jgi:hypothetical protein
MKKAIKELEKVLEIISEEERGVETCIKVVPKGSDTSDLVMMLAAYGVIKKKVNSRIIKLKLKEN